MFSCKTYEHEKLREEYFNLVGYHAGMWKEPEWEFVQELNVVEDGMFESEEYQLWLGEKQNPLGSFME